MQLIFHALTFTEREFISISSSHATILFASAILQVIYFQHEWNYIVVGLMMRATTTHTRIPKTQFSDIDRNYTAVTSYIVYSLLIVRPAGLPENIWTSYSRDPKPARAIPNAI